MFLVLLSYLTIGFISHVNLSDSCEMIKRYCFFHRYYWKPTWRMNNSTRAVSALERLYSFSLSQPALDRFSPREIYEISRRKLLDISRTTLFLVRKLKCKFHTTLPFVLQRMKSAVEIYKAFTKCRIESWNLKQTLFIKERGSVNFMYAHLNVWQLAH